MTSRYLPQDQVISLLLISILPTMLVTLPADLVRSAQHQAWLSFALPTALGCFLFYLIFPSQENRSFLDAMARLDRRVSFAIASGFFAALFLYLIVILGEFAQLVESTFAFRDAPIGVLIVVGSLVATVGSLSGIFVLGRVAQIILPPAFAVTILVLALVIPNGHLLSTLPIWPSHPNTLTGTAFSGPAVFVAEGFLVCLWPVPFNRSRARKSVLTALGIVFVTLTATTWTVLDVFGIGKGAVFLDPFLELGRIVYVAGGFLTHMESIVLPFLVVGQAVKVGVYLFSTTQALHTMLPSVSFKQLTIVLMGAAAGATFLFLPTSTQVNQALYIWLADFATPLWIMAAVTGRLLMAKTAASAAVS